MAKHNEKFSGPFNLITESGPVIILPPEAIDSINAEKNLSFVEYVREEFLSDFDTFRTMRPWPAGMFNEAILKGITRPLRKYIGPYIFLLRPINVFVSTIHKADVLGDSSVPQ